MKFQVEGIYQGRPIPPKVVEGSSAEAVRRAAEARGLEQVVVFPADDPFGHEAPTRPPGSQSEQKPKRPRTWLLLGLLLLMPAVPFISQAITGAIDPPARKVDLGPNDGKIADYPDENPNAIDVPGDTVGVGRRALNWEPGTICEILGSKGSGAPIVQVAAFADFEKSLRAQDEIGSLSSAIKGQWTSLQARTRVRVLGPGPKPGWTEVRVESGEEIGKSGVVMAHTLARLQ